MKRDTIQHLLIRQCTNRTHITARPYDTRFKCARIRPEIVIRALVPAAYFERATTGIASAVLPLQTSVTASVSCLLDPCVRSCSPCS
jgi:hypothetical protein